MRKMMIPLLLTLVCVGCATDPYGNFVQGVKVNQHQLAREAVKQFMVLYSPAKTRLEMKQVPSDAFGLSLVNRLREGGYAVREFNEEGNKSPSSPSSDLALRYVLDEVRENNLYVLTLFVGSHSLTRAYRIQNRSFIPAGNWVHKK